MRARSAGGPSLEQAVRDSSAKPSRPTRALAMCVPWKSGSRTLRDHHDLPERLAIHHVAQRLSRLFEFVFARHVRLELPARGELEQIEGRLATAEAAVRDNETLVEELQALLAAEIRGETLCRAEGTDCTTGLPGDAANAENRRAAITSAELTLNDARAQRDAIAAERNVKQAQIDNELIPAVDFARNASQSTLDAEQSRQQAAADDRQRRLDAKTAEREEAIDAATIDASEADGLLYRIEALESITRGDPFTSFDPALPGAEQPASSNDLNALGMTVWLLRIWILLIDTMPILFKVALSLRSRRPYDALVAAKEEASIAKAFGQVDLAYEGLRGTRWAGVQGDPSLQIAATSVDPGLVDPGLVDPGSVVPEPV